MTSAISGNQQNREFFHEQICTPLGISDLLSTSPLLARTLGGALQLTGVLAFPDIAVRVSGSLIDLAVENLSNLPVRAHCLYLLPCWILFFVNVDFLLPSS